MANIPEYKSIYRFILDVLEAEPATRRELIEKTVASLCPNEERLCQKDLGSEYTRLRSSVGIVLNDMEKKDVIEMSDGGKYIRKTNKTVAIRIDECEEEILKLVSAAPRTKAEIRESLEIGRAHV